MRPGTASTLPANCGTQNECTTSLLLTTMSTGTPTGSSSTSWVATPPWAG